jgi:tetratricopeptide (TPR) repeat protein
VPRRGLSRKELTEKDDITSTLERGMMFAIDYHRPILTGVGAVLVLILGVVGWNFYSASVEAAAQADLAVVIQTYNDTTALPDDQARFNATLAETQRFQENHAGTQASDIAEYYAALSQDGLGNSDESDRMLRELVETGDPTIRDVARFALAESLKKRGDLDAAIAEYEVLADSPDYSRGAILYQLGRLHEAVEMPEEAVRYYESLVSEYPESPFRADVDRALRRLRAGEEGSPS